MKAKSTFLAWNALPLVTWAPGSPTDDGPGLPMAAHGGNISPDRRIIRWMLVYLHHDINEVVASEQLYKRRPAG